MAWSYNNTTTPGVLTSTGGTEASPDSVAAGLAIVQAANAARAQVSIFGAWMDAVEIRVGNSFIRIDDDLHLQIRGSAFINPQNGGVIHGFRSVVRFNTNANRTDNACDFETGSSFICLRERPNDPSPRIDYANTNRMDYPNIQSGATPAKVLIQGLDLYNVAATTASYLKLYFGRATTSSVANVRAFNSNFIINSQYFSTTYNDSYIESLGLPSESIANTVVFNRPVFYRATPSPFNETIRAADITINNPTFLNDCWDGTCSLADALSNSKLRIQYDYTNTFKSGLTPIADVNVRFTRARQSVTGSPTWTAPNATVTATSNAQGTYTAVSLLDAYREGTSGTNLERFNWTAKARTHNRRSAAENIFTNRVFYQGTTNLSAGYSEEVQMLDLAFAPATLAAGLAITGVAFDSAGNCTLTANRTALEIFQAWCSASRNNLDMPDVWRYDGVTLTMGAANLSGTGTATGNFTTTGTITAPVNGSYQDSTGVKANITNLDPQGFGTTWVFGWITTPNYAGRNPALPPASWTGWSQSSGTGNSTQVTLAPTTEYQLFLRIPGYFAPIGPIATIDTATQTSVSLPVIVDTDLVGNNLWPQTAAHMTQAAKFAYDVPEQVVEYNNVTGATEYISFLAAYRALELIAKAPTMAYQLVQPLYVNGTKDGFTLPRGNPLKARMSDASTGGGILQADISYADNQAPAFDRFLANPDNAGNHLLIPQATAGVSASTVADIRSGLALEATLATKASQASVSAIPTNPLLTTDTRLNNLDAAISTRSTLTAPQVRTELATELSRLDVAVSTRLAASAYTAPTTAPTAAQNATAVRAELATELGRVDVAVSSRATPANVTAAQTAIVGEINANEVKIDAVKADTAAIKLKTDAQVNGPTAVQIRAEMEAAGSKLDTAMKAAKSAKLNTL